MLVAAHKNPTMKYTQEHNTPGQYSGQSALRQDAFRKPGRNTPRRPPLCKRRVDVETAASQVYIWAGLLSYGQNLAYPIAREQMCQISRIQADVVRPRPKLSATCVGVVEELVHASTSTHLAETRHRTRAHRDGITCVGLPG